VGKRLDQAGRAQNGNAAHDTQAGVECPSSHFLSPRHLDFKLHQKPLQTVGRASKRQVNSGLPRRGGRIHPAPRDALDGIPEEQFFGKILRQHPPRYGIDRRFPDRYRQSRFGDNPDSLSRHQQDTWKAIGTPCRASLGSPT